MKWVPMVEKAKVRAKFVSMRWLLVLMAIAALLLMAGAHNKWTG